MTEEQQTRKTVLRMISYGLFALGTVRDTDVDLATVNWLTQVSFDPPLLAISVENGSHSIVLMRQTRLFALSVFGDDARDRAAQLGKRWSLNPGKADAVAHYPGKNGCPILSDAVGALECRVLNEMPAGDSTVFLAEITNAEIPREGAPLSMAAAGFRHAG